MKHSLKSYVAASAMLLATMLAGCQSGYVITQISGRRIPVTAEYDATPDSAAVAVLAPYKQVVDSIMSPLIGHSARTMDRHRPESELSNLVADILRQAATPYLGRVADVAITNMGGLRAVLPEGDITYGNIYEITPFENFLTLVTMKGSELAELFEDIARVKGEGLSGARLVITGDGKLVRAEVGGRPLEVDRKYVVATVDYVAEGNDHLDTFARISKEQKQLFPHATLRGIFLNYVSLKEARGELVDSKLDGRIQVIVE